MSFDPIENIDNALKTWYDTLGRLIDLLGKNPLSFSGVGFQAHQVLVNVYFPLLQI